MIEAVLGIKLTDDQTTLVVIDDLTKVYIDLGRDNAILMGQKMPMTATQQDDLHHNWEVMRSIETVMQYYKTEEDYERWFITCLNEIEGNYTAEDETAEDSSGFRIDEIHEHEDGSATLVFEASYDTMKRLAGVGVLEILKRTISEAEPQDPTR